MNKHERIQSLDVLRGLAMIFIILLHSSIYNFANIHKLDFNNPPLLVVIMSFMALWGGIFIIYSAVVNAYMFTSRTTQNKKKKNFTPLLITSFILLIIHYLLNILLGRWNIDFVNNQPDMTFIAGTLRNRTLTFPPLTKWFDGSSLSTIAWNLTFMTGLLSLLFKNNRAQKRKRNYAVLACFGFFIMLFSFVRVALHPLFAEAVETNNYFMAIIYSFLLNNPYPLIPYLAYGCFGTLIGLMIWDQNKNWLQKFILPTGIFFLLFGIIGLAKFEKTISQPDFFWYFKTNFELGLFLILITGIYLLFEKRESRWNKLTFLKWFSRISLTIYLSETFLSEILRILISPLIPQWNQTINGCLLFGIFNILIWLVILFFWRKINFKYSLEYFWVKLCQKLGKQSTKMNFDQV